MVQVSQHICLRSTRKPRMLALRMLPERGRPGAGVGGGGGERSEESEEREEGRGGGTRVRGLHSATHLAFCLVLTEKPSIVAMRMLRSFSSSESASVRSLSLCS